MDATDRMTDAELTVYLGIAGKVGCAKILAGITPEKRAVYENMAQVERELDLWMAGFGPKPQGVIVCHEHQRRRRG